MLQIVLFLVAYLLTENNPVKQVAEDFHKLEGQRNELAFIEDHKDYNDPAIKAYVIAMQMKQIEYLYNPVRQLSLFNDLKGQLSTLARENEDNIHVRYIRFLIQEQTPGFLGYKSDIAVDKAFLKIKLATKDETDYLDKYIIASTSL